MRTQFRSWALIGVMLFLVHGAKAQDPLQKIFDKYKDSVGLSGVAGQLQTSEATYRGLIGMSEPDKWMRANNKFGIGSSTKLFTATMILLLQEQGKLSINDPVSKYIPRMPYIDPGVSIWQLLNHYSGIADYASASLLNYSVKYPDEDYSFAQLMDRLDTVWFAKGDRYAYSNTNYRILAEVITKVKGMSYDSALNELIINPLKLRNTSAVTNIKDPLLAHPMINGLDLHKYPKNGLDAISIGSGNIISDLNDLTKFIRALFIDQSFLKPETLKLMMSFAPAGSSEVGLGVFRKPCGNVYIIGHSGRTLSYISYVYVNPDSGTSLVLLCNDAGNSAIDHILDDCCELMD